MDSGTGMEDYESLISTTDAEELLKRAWRTENRFTCSCAWNFNGNVQVYLSTALEAITPSSQMELIQEWWPITKSLKGSRKKVTLVNPALLIEKYMVHIHKTTELWNRLSKQEQKFAKWCIEDLEDHFEKSVLSKLPD